MNLKTSHIIQVGYALILKSWPICACLFFLTATSLFSQVPPKACFTTTDTLGCVPYTVTMHECTGGDNSIQYNYDSENRNSKWEFDSFHTYTSPGRYKVKQSTQSGGDMTMNKYIVVIDGRAPEFKVYLCENRTVLVDVVDSQFQVYAIDFGDGSPLIETGPNSQVLHTYMDTSPKTVKVTGRFLSGGCPTPATYSVTPVNNLTFERFFKVVNTQDQPKRFGFSFHTNPNLTYDFVDNAGVVVKSFPYSDTLQTFVLEEVLGNCYEFKATNACGETFSSSRLCLEDLAYELSDTSVVLRWNPNDPALVSHYEVRRDGLVLSKLSATSPLEYDDATVKCGKNYCYEVITKFKDSTSYSIQRCMTAQSNRVPDKPYGVVSSFSDENELSIRWSIPKNGSFKIAQLKSLPSQKIELEARDTVYTSREYGKSCYSLVYRDSCDKVSEVVPQICPIFMEVKPAGQGTYAVDWNAYAPVEGEMRYELYEEGRLIYSGSANNFITMEKDTIHQIKTFHILGFTPDGKQVKSNIVKLEQEMRVFFPTAFSPNEDGLNDTFFPKTRFVKSFKMAIYNIWGELVFTTTNMAETWKAENHSNGTYQYVAEAEDFLGNHKEFRGQVTILK